MYRLALGKAGSCTTWFDSRSDLKPAIPRLTRRAINGHSPGGQYGAKAPVTPAWQQERLAIRVPD
jgi:hypothetical protein